MAAFDIDEVRERAVSITASGTDLTFQPPDGEGRTVAWRDRSRSESWTPEMRAAAADRRRKQTNREKEKKNG